VRENVRTGRELSPTEFTGGTGQIGRFRKESVKNQTKGTWMRKRDWRRKFAWNYQHFPMKHTRKMSEFGPFVWKSAELRCRFLKPFLTVTGFRRFSAPLQFAKSDMPSEFGQLVPVDGGNLIPLGKVRCMVGRAPDCDIVLPFRTVSAKHCLLEFRDNAWFVTDLASSNGTKINGERRNAGQLLHGSILSIAEFKFEVRYVGSPPPPAPSYASPPAPLEMNSEISQVSATEVGEKSAAGQPAPSSGAGSIPATAILGKLVALDGEAEIPLKGIRLLIGRAPACNIVLPYPEVSGKHCQLDLQDGVWHVRDLGSRNGIQVDGKSGNSLPMRPNSVLSVAKRRFKIVYELPPAEVPASATIDLSQVGQGDQISFADTPGSLFSLELPP
jgi:adenylate cyclase